MRVTSVFGANFANSQAAMNYLQTTQTTYMKLHIIKIEKKTNLAILILVKEASNVHMYETTHVNMYSVNVAT